jgi:GMP synthase-like glutamine amidotransferase
MLADSSGFISTMTEEEFRPARVALLDMYDGAPNLGMESLRSILKNFGNQIEWTEFDVRSRRELPGIDFDLFVSTGGPGSPLLSGHGWELGYRALLDRLWAHNQNPLNKPKPVFFICHSFQMLCQHFGLGTASLRRSPSFGIFPVHKTQYGVHDPLLESLPDPLWAVDMRDWQVVHPDFAAFERFGAQILAIERMRDHIQYERALMAVRFGKHFFGTQFHPEADPAGMLHYMKQPERIANIIRQHGEATYQDMLQKLKDPGKLEQTYRGILPRFLELGLLQTQEV